MSDTGMDVAALKARWAERRDNPPMPGERYGRLLDALEHKIVGIEAAVGHNGDPPYLACALWLAWEVQRMGGPNPPERAGSLVARIESVAAGEPGPPVRFAAPLDEFGWGHLVGMCAALQLDPGELDA